MKKIIGLLLVLTMIISVLPLGVYAADATEENLVLKTGTKFKKLGASDTWGDVPSALKGGQYPPYYAVNKTETAGEGRKYAWLAYDFGISCQLTEIEIINNTTDYGSIHCAIVEASNNEDFTDCVELGRTAKTAYGSKAVVTIPVNDTNTYRYVRVRKDNTADWSVGNLIVDDVNVYGYYELGNLKVVGSNITEGQTLVTNSGDMEYVTVTFNQSIASSPKMGNGNNIRLYCKRPDDVKSESTFTTCFMTNNASTLNIPLNYLESNCEYTLVFPANKMKSTLGKYFAEAEEVTFNTGIINMVEPSPQKKLKNILLGKNCVAVSKASADTNALTNSFVTGEVKIQAPDTDASGARYITYDLLGNYKPVKFEYHVHSGSTMEQIMVYGSNVLTSNTNDMTLLHTFNMQYAASTYQGAHQLVDISDSYRYITFYKADKNFNATEFVIYAEVDTLTDKFGCDTTPVDFAVDTNGNLNASFQLINTTAEAVTVNVPNMLLAVYNEAEGADILVAATALTANTERDVTLASKANETVTVTVTASVLSGKSYTKAKLMFIDDWSTLKPYCPAREAVFGNQ